MQLNAQDINVILSTLSVEVQDEEIFNGQPPPESAHLIWTRFVELYGKSKCDDALENRVNGKFVHYVFMQRRNLIRPQERRD